MKEHGKKDAIAWCESEIERSKEWLEDQARMNYRLKEERNGVLVDVTNDWITRHEEIIEKMERLIAAYSALD